MRTWCPSEAQRLLHCDDVHCRLLGGFGMVDLDALTDDDKAELLAMLEAELIGR